MERKEKRSRQGVFDLVIKICLSICLLFTLILFIYGQFFVKNASLYANKCDHYDAVWSYTDPNGVTRQYRAPDVFDVRGVDDVKLSMTLPDKIQEGNCLFIQTGKDLDAYIDGDLRNSYRISRSVFGRTVKGMWLSITLRASDAGKTLTLVRPGYWLDEYVLSEVYIGNRLGFATQLIHDNLFILVLGFAIIVFGLVITAICFVYRFRSRRTFPLWFLSIGVLGGAFWLIFDNFTYPLFFQNYFVDGIVEFLLLMMLPFPFAAYIHSLLENRYSKLYNVICVLVIVNFITLTVLHFADIADYLDTLVVSNILMGLVALYCFGVIIYDTFIAHHRENLVVTVGFCIFAVLCLIEIVHVNLPIHTNDGVFVAIGLLILLVMAVTYEVRRISELRAETLKAQSANQAKSTFLANMSHEIRTPINAILGMDEMILREDIDPKVREYAMNIKGAGTALLEIISDVLDLSKIEQGKMEIYAVEYETRPLVRSIVTMIGVKADEKGLLFVKEISKELPSKFIGDEKHIREVMLNLLGNAVKYTPSGSITLSIRHEETDEKHATLCISVKDTGIGIRESDREKLFKEFERLDLSKTRSVEGTGLGLAITANLVRLMGGTIECESTYGEGTEFRVRIPQIITDAVPIGEWQPQEAEREPEPEEKKPTDLSGVHALIVDDNELNLKVAGGLLRILKVTSVTCLSGQEMLERITKERFDVILLDHMMPVMDGIETLARTRGLEGNLNSDTPYIALTANAVAGAREMYLEKGFTDYLSKPMTLEELAEVISSALHR